jgi:biopolymer transport protein ExbD
MKLRSQGILIRLIDVVLILLFGFVSISQLERRSKVNLPVSSESKLNHPDPENLLRVSIYPYDDNQYGFLVENESLLLKDIQDLHRYLKHKKQYFIGEIRIKIYAEASSPIKYTMQVADLCEQLGIKKSLVMKLKSGKSGLR